MNNFKNIYVLGDIHGEFNTAAHNIKLRNIEDALIIQVGDFGMGFGSTKTYACLDKLADTLKSNNCQLWCIRGNHDDPKFWQKEVTVKDCITFIPDYTEKVVNGKLCLFIGGGISIDRQSREVGKNYWENEAVQLGVLSGRKVDFLFTHSSASRVFPHKITPILLAAISVDAELTTDIEKERSILQTALDLANPAEYFYGHYHARNHETFHGKSDLIGSPDYTTNVHCLDIHQLFELYSRNSWNNKFYEKR